MHIELWKITEQANETKLTSKQEVNPTKQTFKHRTIPEPKAM